MGTFRTLLSMGAAMAGEQAAAGYGPVTSATNAAKAGLASRAAGAVAQRVGPRLNPGQFPTAEAAQEYGQGVAASVKDTVQMGQRSQMMTARSIARTPWRGSDEARKPFNGVNSGNEDWRNMNFRNSYVGSTLGGSRNNWLGPALGAGLAGAAMKPTPMEPAPVMSGSADAPPAMVFPEAKVVSPENQEFSLAASAAPAGRTAHFSAGAAGSPVTEPVYAQDDTKRLSGPLTTKPSTSKPTSRPGGSSRPGGKPGTRQPRRTPGFTLDA